MTPSTVARDVGRGISVESERISDALNGQLSQTKAASKKECRGAW